MALLATSYGSAGFEQMTPRISVAWSGSLAAAPQTGRRLWLAPPGRLRVEVIREGKLARLGVRTGRQGWRGDRVEGATAGEIEPAGRRGAAAAAGPAIVDAGPADRVIASRPGGLRAAAGRAVVLAHARPGRRRLRGELSSEFEFDAGHGTVLHRIRGSNRVRCRAIGALTIWHTRSMMTTAACIPRLSLRTSGRPVHVLVQTIPLTDQRGHQNPLKSRTAR